MFSAAAFGADSDHTEWVQDRLATTDLEVWAKKQLKKEDVVVLEASGNSFEVASRLHAIGHIALVLEGAQAGKIRDNFCNDDRHIAVKLARVYRSGLAKEVWPPDVRTREHREVFFAHRNTVKDAARGRNRIPTAKKLVGYLALAPRKTQSGNNKKGYDSGVGRFGRGDVRARLLQSAHNALIQRTSPLHKWGWKLLVKKHRNQAAVAVARKLTVSIWHLLMGHGTPLLEASDHLRTKLLKLATLIGKDAIQSLGFDDRNAFVAAQIKSIQLSP